MLFLHQFFFLFVFRFIFIRRPDNIIENAKPVASGLFSIPSGPRHAALRKLWRPFLTTQKYQDTISRIFAAHVERFEKTLEGGLNCCFPVFFLSLISSLVAASGPVDMNELVASAMFDALMDLTVGANLDSRTNPKYFEAW